MGALPLSNPGDAPPRPDPGLEVKDAQTDLLGRLGRPGGEVRPRPPAVPPRVHLAGRGAPGPARGPTPRSSPGPGTSPPRRSSSAPCSTARRRSPSRTPASWSATARSSASCSRSCSSPQYHDGVIVDGFPRTQVQGECLQLFYHKLLELHAAYRGTPLARYFRKPSFRIALLYVSEKVSVERQLKRGREIREHNRRVRETGEGKLLEERETDLDPDLCRKRVPDVHQRDVRRPAAAAADLPLPLHRRRGRAGRGPAEHRRRVRLPEQAGAEPGRVRADPEHPGGPAARGPRPPGAGRAAGGLRREPPAAVRAGGEAGRGEDDPDRPGPRHVRARPVQQRGRRCSTTRWPCGC